MAIRWISAVTSRLDAIVTSKSNHDMVLKYCRVSLYVRDVIDIFAQASVGVSVFGEP
jgi:hypothetical protein